MSIIFGEVGKKILGKGLAAAFPEEGTKGGEYQAIPPRFQTASMVTPSEAGKVGADFGELEHETTGYNTHLLAWEKRLFGDNSYTNITLPKVDV